MAGGREIEKREKLETIPSKGVDQSTNQTVDDLTLLTNLAGALPESSLKEFQKKVVDPIDVLTKNTPKYLAEEVLPELKVGLNFKEKDKHISIVRDVIGLVRNVAGKRETYFDKLEREKKKGHKESASYGWTRLGDHNAMLYSTHLGFFMGSFGAAAGEKFLRAAIEAGDAKEALIGIYASAGARQHENLGALTQMSRAVYGINYFKKMSKMPYISIICDQTWGGISASAVPLGDFIFALPGTKYGFSGPRVIKSFSFEDVPEGFQSAEAHVIRRNVDLLVDNPKQLKLILERFIDNAKAVRGNRKREIKKEEVKSIPKISEGSRFIFKREGFYNLLSDDLEENFCDLENFRFNPRLDTTDLYNRSEYLKRDPLRVDTHYLIQACFSDIVPLYNWTVLGDRIDFPPIITAIGKVGKQPFLIVGNQPSYRVKEDRIVKIPAGPRSEDFKFVKRVLDYAQRSELPVVTFTDTFGASPILRDEERDQSRAIAEAIYAGMSLDNIMVPIVTGFLGSGGGLGTTPWVREVAMLETGMGCVASAESVASIIYNKAHPSIEEVKTTLNTLRPTSLDQLQLKLINKVIPDEGQGNKVVVAKAVQEHIIDTYNSLCTLTLKERRRLKHDWILSLHGMPLSKR